MYVRYHISQMQYHPRVTIIVKIKGRYNHPILALGA